MRVEPSELFFLFTRSRHVFECVTWYWHDDKVENWARLFRRYKSWLRAWIPPPFYLQNDRFELCHDLCNPIVPYRGMPSQKISKCDGGERGSCSRNLQVCCLKNLVLIILIEEECRILDLMVHWLLSWFLYIHPYVVVML